MLTVKLHRHVATDFMLMSVMLTDNQRYLTKTDMNHIARLNEIHNSNFTLQSRI